MQIRFCPNKECRYARGSESRFYWKRGYFTTKWNAQPVARYQCRDCLRYFSSHTFRATYQQKKPFLNREVLDWYSSGVTLRRMAKVMRINRKTVTRKFLFLAKLSATVHQRKLESGSLAVSVVQFDEQESFEHTRLKPLSMAVAVNADTGDILVANVSSMNAKGRLSAIARRKYGVRPDTRAIGRKAALHTVAHATKEKLVVLTDSHPAYPGLIKTILPTASHRAVKSRGEIRFLSQRRRRRNERDPLFTLNYTLAKLRHDLSRLSRKVWVTTKKASRLQAHLSLYIAYNNGYTLPI